MVVVSYLLSLMQDQVQKFSAMNVTAAYIGYDTKTDSEILFGKYELVFTSPENCLKYHEMFSSDIYQKQFCCFAIDEAHCVEKWSECLLYSP